MPYLRSLSSFRDGVRAVAIDAAKNGDKSPEALKEILALCDRLRDVDLVPLGVALDDQEGKPLCQFEFLELKFVCFDQMDGLL